jgi:N-sulfoglucosamine sulfohydrolase
LQTGSLNCYAIFSEYFLILIQNYKFKIKGQICSWVFGAPDLVNERSSLFRTGALHFPDNNIAFVCQCCVVLSDHFKIKGFLSKKAKRNTMKDQLIKLSLLTGSVMFSTGMVASAKKAFHPGNKPNVIIIIADDAGWNDSGAYGNSGIRTPNIDRLSREGMTFTNAFLTISSCSPSRCSIMTGLYPHNTGAGELHLPLPPNKNIFPGELKKAGYYTVSSGKWHLGPDRTEFDSIFHAREASGAADWIRALQNRPKDKPFFMWLASNDPHRPYEDGIIPNPNRAADVWVPPYIPDNDSTRKDLTRYYDEITRLDSNIGKVLDELDRQGIENNTVVIFMSDNGRPFPRCKTRVYDSGVKTPLLIRWPGHIEAGSRSNSLTSSVDMAPTLCELAGVAAPKEFQGKSMVKLFSEPDAKIRDFVFAEHNWHDYQADERMVRDKRYLYVRNRLPGLNASPPADAVTSITYQEMIRLYQARE